MAAFALADNTEIELAGRQHRLGKFQHCAVMGQVAHDTIHRRTTAIEGNSAAKIRASPYAPASVLHWRPFSIQREACRFACRLDGATCMPVRVVSTAAYIRWDAARYISSSTGGSNQLVSDSPPSTTIAAPVT